MNKLLPPLTALALSSATLPGVFPEEGFALPPLPDETPTISSPSRLRFVQEVGEPSQQGAPFTVNIKKELQKNIVEIKNAFNVKPDWGREIAEAYTIFTWMLEHPLVVSKSEQPDIRTLLLQPFVQYLNKRFGCENVQVKEVEEKRRTKAKLSPKESTCIGIDDIKDFVLTSVLYEAAGAPPVSIGVFNTLDIQRFATGRPSGLRHLIEKLHYSPKRAEEALPKVLPSSITEKLQRLKGEKIPLAVVALASAFATGKMESNFSTNPFLKSSVNARGTWQFIESTAKASGVMETTIRSFVLINASSFVINFNLSSAGDFSRFEERTLDAIRTIAAHNLSSAGILRNNKLLMDENHVFVANVFPLFLDMLVWWVDTQQEEHGEKLNNLLDKLDREMKKHSIASPPKFRALSYRKAKKIRSRDFGRATGSLKEDEVQKSFSQWLYG